MNTFENFLYKLYLNIEKKYKHEKGRKKYINYIFKKLIANIKKYTYLTAERISSGYRVHSDLKKKLFSLKKISSPDYLCTYQLITHFLGHQHDENRNIIIFQ